MGTAARRGAAGRGQSDALIDFARGTKWQAKLMEVAQACVLHAESDWGVYCTAYDAGAVGPVTAGPAPEASSERGTAGDTVHETKRAIKRNTRGDTKPARKPAT